MEASCEAFDVGVDGLDRFFREFRSRNMGEEDNESSDEWRGFAISSPNKEAIIPLLDRLHPLAEAIGAVNTVRVVRRHLQEDGTGRVELVGYNTDWLGVTRALKEHVAGGAARVKTLKWKKALVVGAGGAARAAVYALKELDMHVYCVNRTDERAAIFSKDLGIARLPFSFSDPTSDNYPCENFDVVINATSVGLESHASPLPIHFWEEFGNGIALDFVYHSSDKARAPLAADHENHKSTRFLEEADRAGWETIDGKLVLARQGVEQFAVLSGRPIDVLVFDRVLEVS